MERCQSGLSCRSRKPVPARAGSSNLPLSANFQDRSAFSLFFNSCLFFSRCQCEQHKVVVCVGIENLRVQIPAIFSKLLLEVFNHFKLYPFKVFLSKIIAQSIHKCSLQNRLTYKFFHKTKSPRFFHFYRCSKSIA